MLKPASRYKLRARLRAIAKLNSTQEELNQAQTELISLQAELKSDRASLNAAKSKRDRYLIIAKSGALSQNQLYK